MKRIFEAVITLFYAIASACALFCAAGDGCVLLLPR